MALVAFTKTCAKHSPGATRLVIFNAKEIDTATLASGDLTVLTMKTAGDSVEIAVDRDSLKVISEGTGTKNGISYVTQAVEFTLAKIDKAVIETINSLADASPCGMGALVYTNNKVWLCAGLQKTAVATVAEGVNGLFLPSHVGDTGSDPTAEDGDMFTIRLEGVLPDHVIPVASGSVITPANVNLVAPE